MCANIFGVDLVINSTGVCIPVGFSLVIVPSGRDIPMVNLGNNSLYPSVVYLCVYLGFDLYSGSARVDLCIPTLHYTCA